MIQYQEKGIGLFEFLSGQGYTLYQLDGVWVAEPAGSDAIVNALIAAYQPSAPRPITAIEFTLRFTISESIAIRASADPVVKEWVRRLDDPRLLEVDLERQEVVDGLNYLVTEGLLTSARADEILA